MAKRFDRDRLLQAFGMLGADLAREGYDEALLAPSVRAVAERMGLGPDWLNDAVDMYTPLDEDETLFSLFGSYPSGSAPGLRTVLAKPHYLLAMKLQAPRNLDRGNRDLDDARALAAHFGLVGADALDRLYVSAYGEAPHSEARLRFKAVLAGGTA